MISGDRGVGLVIIMMVMVAMLGLTGAVISLATTQTAVVVNYRRSMELLYAAEAALELVIQDLGRPGAWDRALRGHPTSQRWSTDAHARMVDGTVLDLMQVTGELRRASATLTPSSWWRLAGHARFSTVAPVRVWTEADVAAVWLSNARGGVEDGSESESRTRLVVHVAAFGPSVAWRAVRATVRRHAEGWVEVVLWRVVR